MDNTIIIYLDSVIWKQNKNKIKNKSLICFLLNIPLMKIIKNNNKTLKNAFVCRERVV